MTYRTSDKAERDELQRLLFGGSVHVLGASGIGMSSLTHALLDVNSNISIEDIAQNHRFKSLVDRGARVIDTAEHMTSSPDVVIYSSAITWKIGDRFPRSRILHRSEALSILCDGKKLLLIGGTHGKSTTTFFLIRLFQEWSIPCSYVLGAESDQLYRNGLFDSNAEFFIAEGDESDGTLANYSPYLFLVNLISDDHMDYFVDLKSLISLFRKTAKAASITISYDKNPSLLQDEIRFGENDASHYKVLNSSTYFTSLIYRGEQCQIEHGIPGKHNGVNVVAAISAFHRLFGASIAAIASKIKVLSHLTRRMELVANVGCVSFFDDYSTHPDALKQLIETLNSLSRRKRIAIFQPIRWSRNVNFTRDFGRLLSKLDLVFIYRMHYRSGEKISGYHPTDMLYFGENMFFISDIELIEEIVTAILAQYDTVITISGVLGGVAKRLAKRRVDLVLSQL